MEQYWMPKALDFENLRYCLDNYETDSIFIRLVGSSGGTVKVYRSRIDDRHSIDKPLDFQVLDFKKNNSGLHMIIDNSEVFQFPLKNYNDNYQKGFSIGYNRVDDKGRKILLQRGIDPDDPELPTPIQSTFRTVIDNHLMEIDFKGKIPLEFHSWWDEPHWKYWTVKKH